MSAPSPLFLALPTRCRALLHALLVAAALVLAFGLLPSGTAAAAAPAVQQCNGSDNAAAAEVRCEVTIANTLDLATGAGSSTVTVQECHGAPAAPTCSTPTTTSFSDVTTTVEQCNGSGNAGGSVVACSVRITNTVTGAATTSSATINQCNGSGQGGGTQPTVQCSPPGSTTGATVTQCNDSGNGGGGTTRVRCTVDPSTQSAALPVTINQCNGSGNGGGGTVTCRSSVTFDIRAAQAAPSPSAAPPAPSPSSTPAASPAASPTAAPVSSPAPSAIPAQPSAPATPAAPVAVVAPPAPDVQAPVSAPVVGPPVDAPAVPLLGQPLDGATGAGLPLLPSADGPVVLTGSGTLPRTGAELGALPVLGLLLTALGGALVLLVGRAPRPVGRHVRPAR